MKKKLALIIISVDECLSKKGFSGGGHKVTKNLIDGLIDSDLFEIDIFCKKSLAVTTGMAIDGVNSISVLGKKDFGKKLSNELNKKTYDYILASDVLLPYGNLILHSNSAKYKSNNGKKGLMKFLTNIYNSAKILKQKQLFSKNDKSIFAVSNSLKLDYALNYDIPKERIFVCYPPSESISESHFEKKDKFTIGAIAGGGLNKGGFLLLFAIRQFVSKYKIKPEKFSAKLIFPKFNKSGLFRFLIKFLRLSNFVELLPKQSDMNAFYNSIDCYVLPSLNEAFGLVVPESASNFRPSIVSSTTGVSELIKDMQNGFLFDRINSPVRSLSDCLNKVFQMYFNDYETFKNISLTSNEISKKLLWKEFCDTIIKNMKEEND